MAWTGKLGQKFQLFGRQGTRNRPMSNEMGDHWSKNELDDELRRPTWMADDTDWQTPFGQDYDPNDLYSNLDMTPGFAGGAGEGASEAWQKGGDPPPGPGDLNICAAKGEGWTWDAETKTCLPPEDAPGEEDCPDGPNGEKFKKDAFGKCQPAGYLIGKYTGTFQEPTDPGMRDAPAWKGPDIPDVADFSYKPWEAPDEFKAPTMEEAQAAPGFQMRMEQGRKALEASAASKGMLRSGQTYTDLMDYGQRMGEMGYQDVYGRRAKEYDRSRRNLERDYGTGYDTARDIYGIGRENILGRYGLEFGEAQQQYEPRMAQWEMEARNYPARRTEKYNQAWTRFQDDERRWEAQQKKERDWATFASGGAQPG